MRKTTLIAAVVVLALLAVGHWAWWYRSRERPGVPDAGSTAGRLFLGSDLPLRVWLPYPHQNLGELEKALGDAGGLLESLAEITGRETPRLPEFGGVGIPPSSELAIVADRSGERFVVAAKVYPMAALLARWAGRLAGNPLLAGGRAEVDGRRLEVSWSGGEWVVVSEGAAFGGASSLPTARPLGRDEGAPALAWIDLAEPQGSMPRGRYRLERQGEDLQLSGGDPRALAALASLDRVEAPLPLVAAQTFSRHPPLEARLLALVPGAESIAGLPGAVAASRGKRRWKLPGERVLSVVGGEPHETRIAGWKVTALDRDSLAAGKGLVELSRGLEGAPPLEIALWIERRGAGRLVAQIIEALERVPVIGSREARPWRAAADVLERFDRYRRLTVFVSTEPTAVRIRLERRRRDGRTVGGEAGDAEGERDGAN